MSRAGVLLAFVAGAAGGFLLAQVFGGAGTADRAPARTPTEIAHERRAAAEARARLDEMRLRVEELENDKKLLQIAYEEFAERHGLELPKPGESVAGPPKGSRLEDGRIVGGARFPEITANTFVGFMENFFERFKKEAKLSPEKEELLRNRMEFGVRSYLDLMANTLNGDISADEVYATMNALTEEGRKQIGTYLDENQSGIYARFEEEVQRYVRSNIVSNEVSAMRDTLKLDSEQEKAISAIVATRYRKVQSKIEMAIPGFMFRALRRSEDTPIYEETAREIRELLRPEQAEAYDKFEKEQPVALNAYRTMLVPK